MATFLMLGNYSAKANKGISVARTKNANRIFKKRDSSGLSLHVPLGPVRPGTVD